MVEFFIDEGCTEKLIELRFDDSYVEDIYGGVLENVVEIGTVVYKIIYAKNFDSDMIVISKVESDSPFVSTIIDKPRLGTGEVTPIRVTFSPTIDEIDKINNITDEETKKQAKEKLLKGSIKVSQYRIITSDI